MSQKKHLEDEEQLGKHKQSGDACLNRHVGHYAESNSCSYRAQAKKRALSDAELYDWPAYESLANRPEDIETSAREKNGRTVPSWYGKTLKSPAKNAWDLDHKNNFKDKCYEPYWHESHHLVPNSTLSRAISEVGNGMDQPAKVVQAVRGGLLDAGYNLNDKANMFMLPMDRRVALALGLPKHRKTPDHRSHAAYSLYVLGELREIIGAARDDLEAHGTAIVFAKCRGNIEALSRDLYEAVKSAGRAMKNAAEHRDALDDMSREEFGVARMRPAKVESKTSDV